MLFRSNEPLDKASAEKAEELEAVGISAKDLKRASIYRPLTMSYWMFDAVSDLTKPTYVYSPCCHWTECAYSHTPESRTH